MKVRVNDNTIGKTARSSISRQAMKKTTEDNVKNKLAKLRRHASRVHFADYTLDKYTLEKYTLKQIHIWKYTFGNTNCR